MKSKHFEINIYEWNFSRVCAGKSIAGAQSNLIWMNIRVMNLNTNTLNFDVAGKLCRLYDSQFNAHEHIVYKCIHRFSTLKTEITNWSFEMSFWHYCLKITEMLQGMHTHTHASFSVISKVNVNKVCREIGH